MINQTCKPKMALTIVLLIAMGFCNLVQSQTTPTVSVRLANPTYSCETGLYCLDVEFQADVPDVQLFGMNVRFFYPDDILELSGFSDFQGGYGPVAPNPPTVIPSAAGFGTNFFGFPAPGVADWVNGAIQLVDGMQPAIILGTQDWTKLFQICFTVQGPIADSTNFCPPIVWDLELNPANGGYLAGDDGVVITVRLCLHQPMRMLFSITGCTPETDQHLHTEHQIQRHVLILYAYLLLLQLNLTIQHMTVKQDCIASMFCLGPMHRIFHFLV
jgi:hypothetical protein